MARAFQRDSELSLMFSTSASAFAGLDFHVTGKVATETFSVFVVDIGDTLIAKRAGLWGAHNRTATAESNTTGWIISTRHG